MPQPEKLLIVCADDFGMNPGVDAGILELAGRGRLSAASCLVQGATFAGHAQALRDTGAQVGLHLNFTEALAPGQFCQPLGALIRSAWLGRLDAASLREQVARQFDAFEDAAGRPDFVDGHQHVHQFPGIRQALLAELEQRYKRPELRPWLRSTRMRAQPGTSLALRVKAGIIEALGAHAFARQAQKKGYALNGRFGGVYDFRGGQQAYRKLLALWLRNAGDGDVLMCHPAAYAYPGDALGEQRAAEFAVWSSDATAQWLRDYGLSLRGPSPGARLGPGA